MCSLCCCVKKNFSKSGYCCVYHPGPSGSPPPPVDPVKTFRLVLAPVAMPPPPPPPHTHTRPCVHRLVNDEGRESQHCHAVCLAVDFPLALAVTEHGGAIIPGLLRRESDARLARSLLRSAHSANCRQGEGCFGRVRVERSWGCGET